MLVRLQQWLAHLQLRDPIEQQQAMIVQLFLLGVMCIAPLATLIFASILGFASGTWILVLAPVVCVPIALIALVLLRRDQFTSSIRLMVFGFILVFALTFFALGAQQGSPLFVVFFMPITLAGLLLERRSLLIVIMTSIVIVLLSGLLEPLLPNFIGFVSVPVSLTIPALATFVFMAGLIGFLLERFGRTLHEVLLAAQSRGLELEHHRATLEATVAERTETLQQSVQALAQREIHLTQALADLRTSQAVVQELSAPIIPVLPGVLVMPLVGAMDGGRAALLMEHIIRRVAELHSQHIIFDITGVPIIDTHVAQVLIQTAAAVRLLGGKVLLVGVRPEVAQTMVALNIDLGSIATYADLQEAIEALLLHTGWSRHP